MSDDSEDDMVKIRNGNVPKEWYDDELHPGYNVKGQKVTRLEGSDKLDSIIDKNENDAWFRTIVDELNQKKVVISEKQLEMIRKLRTGQYLDDNMRDTNYSVSLDTTGFIHPFDNSIPSKRSFVPSKWERIKVNKLVKAIKNGWLKVDDDEEIDSDPEEPMYDLWGEDAVDPFTAGKLPPPLVLPKLVKPLHDESYNPPKEYLPTEKEVQEWNESHPDDREKNYVPQQHDCLRKVPVYESLIRERFERCLDLYLAPRIKKRKVHMDPDSLLPELPPPSSLRPFPSFPNVYYKGHSHRIRAIKVDMTGRYLVSGDESGLLLVFDVNTARILRRIQFEGKIASIDWSRDGLIAVAATRDIHIINPSLQSREEMDNIEGMIEQAKKGHLLETNVISRWVFYEEDSEEWNTGLRITIPQETLISQVIFHSRGDYFASVSPKAKQNIQVLIHSFSKGKSQKPFAKSKSNIQRVLFHHTKPIFFIATQQHIWVFDLKKQVMIKKLMSGVKWYSCLALHPGGDNLIAGSYDKRLNWFDLDLSEKPY